MKVELASAGSYKKKKKKKEKNSPALNDKEKRTHQARFPAQPVPLTTIQPLNVNQARK